MHNRLIRLVLEISLPAVDELRSRPFLHLIEFLLRRPDLHTRIDTIGSQRSSTLQIPLIIDFLLNLRIAANEIIKRLDIWLSPEDRESEVMVLEVAAYAG